MRHPRRSQKQLIAGNSKTASNEPTRLPGTPDLMSVPGAVNGFVNVQESTRHGDDIGLEAQMMTTGYTGALVFAAVTALPPAVRRQLRRRGLAYFGKEARKGILDTTGVHQSPATPTSPKPTTKH